MAAALVQKAKAHSNLGNATFTLSFPSPCTPGNTVLVYACSYYGIVLSDSVDDNQGNGAYTRDVMQPSDGRQHTTNFGLYRKNAIAASGTFSVNYHLGSAAANPNVYIAEYSGLASGAPDADSEGMMLTNDFPCPFGPLTPTQAEDLFITMYNFAGQLVGSTSSVNPNPDGFTVLDTEDDGTTYSCGGWAHLIPTDAAAKQGTWTHAQANSTNDTCWSVTAYKTGAAGPPPQALRPDADLATAGWSTAPLWSKVDEDVAGGDVISAVSA
jgi:hypothetical protein